MSTTMLAQLGLAVIASSIAVGAVLAGELRPLPSPPSLSGQSATAEQRAALERYYLEFGERARLLNPSQRTQLTREFESLRQAAERGARAGEAAHYSRLIAILSQTG